MSFAHALVYLGWSPHWRWQWPLHLTCPHICPLSRKNPQFWGWSICHLSLCLIFGVDSGDGPIARAAVQRWHRLLRHSEGELKIFAAEISAFSWEKSKLDFSAENRPLDYLPCIMQSWSSCWLLYYVCRCWLVVGLQPSAQLQTSNCLLARLTFGPTSIHQPPP